MNFEQEPLEQEPKAPSFEEMRAKIESFVGHRDYKILRSKEDKWGVYLWEVEAKTDDGIAEYQYMRKGVHAPTLRSTTSSIEVVYYDATKGRFLSGATLADYDEATGTWIDAPR